MGGWSEDTRPCPCSEAGEQDPEGLPWPCEPRPAQGCTPSWEAVHTHYQPEGPGGLPRPEPWEVQGCFVCKEASGTPAFLLGERNKDRQTPGESLFCKGRRRWREAPDPGASPRQVHRGGRQRAWASPPAGAERGQALAPDHQSPGAGARRERGRE